MTCSSISLSGYFQFCCQYYSSIAPYRSCSEFRSYPYEAVGTLLSFQYRNIFPISRSSEQCSILTLLLILWRRVIFKNLTGLQLVKKFPHFMEPEGSLPHSQIPATSLYLEPARSSSYPHILLPEDQSYYYHPI
jgi:hypothetical protein